MIVHNSLSTAATSSQLSTASGQQTPVEKVDSVSSASQFSEDAVVMTLSDEGRSYNIGDHWSVKLNQLNAVSEIGQIMNFEI